MKERSGKSNYPEGIEQLAHSIVSTWVSDCSINLRPLDRYALKKIIAQSIPQYVEARGANGTRTGIAAVREHERRACIEAIANLKEEPFPGYVSKQRALNACHTTGRHTEILPDHVSEPMPGVNRNNVSAGNT